jgi:hypothetical protein
MLAPLCLSLLGKIHEQIDLTDHLIGLLPEDRLDWKPEMPGSWTTAVLLGHLLECLAGFCAVLYSAAPEKLAHFAQLRGLPVNHACGRAEARARIRDYRAAIDEGFSALRDSDLSRSIPTVFVPQGEPLMTLLLRNFEHLVNHKHQLFTNLRLMGVAAGTADLYSFRGK